MVSPIRTNCVIEYVNWPSTGTTVTNSAPGASGYDGTLSVNRYEGLPSGATAQVCNPTSTTTDYIDIPKGSVIDTLGAHTMEFIFYHNSYKTANLFSKYHWETGNNAYSIAVDMASGDQFIAVYRTGADDNVVHWKTPPGSMVPGVWYDVQISWNASNTTNSPTVKINGVTQPLTRVGLTTSGSWLTDSSADAYLFNDSVDIGYMNGTLALFRLHSVALSANDQDTNYIADSWIAAAAATPISPYTPAAPTKRAFLCAFSTFTSSQAAVSWSAGQIDEDTFYQAMVEAGFTEIQYVDSARVDVRSNLTNESQALASYAALKPHIALAHKYGLDVIIWVEIGALVTHITWNMTMRESCVDAWMNTNNPGYVAYLNCFFTETDPQYKVQGFEQEQVTDWFINWFSGKVRQAGLGQKIIQHFTSSRRADAPQCTAGVMTYSPKADTPVQISVSAAGWYNCQLIEDNLACNAAGVLWGPKSLDWLIGTGAVGTVAIGTPTTGDGFTIRETATGATTTFPYNASGDGVTTWTTAAQLTSCINTVPYIVSATTNNAGVITVAASELAPEKGAETVMGQTGTNLTITQVVPRTLPLVDEVIQEFYSLQEPNACVDNFVYIRENYPNMRLGICAQSNQNADSVCYLARTQQNHQWWANLSGCQGTTSPPPYASLVSDISAGATSLTLANNTPGFVTGTHATIMDSNGREYIYLADVTGDVVTFNLPGTKNAYTVSAGAALYTGCLNTDYEPNFASALPYVGASATPNRRRRLTDAILQVKAGVGLCDTDVLYSESNVLTQVPQLPVALAYRQSLGLTEPPHLRGCAIYYDTSDSDWPLLTNRIGDIPDTSPYLRSGSYDATLYGPTLVSNALVFDGANDYITIPAGLAHSFQKFGYTVEFEFYHNAASLTTTPTIFWQQAGTVGRWACWIDTITQSLHIAHTTDTGDLHYKTADGSLAYGTQYNVQIKWDLTTMTSAPIIRINGARQTITTVTQTYTSTIAADSGNPMYIGSDGTNANPANMSLLMFRFYPNIMLTDQELSENSGIWVGGAASAVLSGVYPAADVILRGIYPSKEE